MIIRLWRSLMFKATNLFRFWPFVWFIKDKQMQRGVKRINQEVDGGGVHPSQFTLTGLAATTRSWAQTLLSPPLSPRLSTPALFFILKNLPPLRHASPRVSPPPPALIRLRGYISAPVRARDVFTWIISLISCPSIHPLVCLFTPPSIRLIEPLSAHRST